MDFFGKFWQFLEFFGQKLACRGQKPLHLLRNFVQIPKLPDFLILGPSLYPKIAFL